MTQLNKKERIVLFAGILLAGLANRIRGGLFSSTGQVLQGKGKMINVVFVGLFLTVVGYFLHIPFAGGFGFAMSLATFAGQSLKWGEWIGRIVVSWKDWDAIVWLSIRGLVWSDCLALAAYYWFPDKAIWIAQAGLTMGPAYWIAARSWELVKEDNDTREWESGEVTFGWVLIGLITYILVI